MSIEPSPERQAAIAAFAEVATPEEALKAAEVDDAVNTVVAAALSIDVRNSTEAEAATEFLARLAAEKKRAEEARRFLVDPMNRHVKAINARFKTTTEPLEQADGIVRGKVLGYRQRLEQARRVEQARLEAEAAERQRQADDERRRLEAEARAAREAAAREAAALEAAARRAEEDRHRQMQAAADQRRREISELTDDALRLLVQRNAVNEDGVLARGELDARRHAREAMEAAAAARAAEDEARAAEEAVRAEPPPDMPGAVVAAPAPLRSASGGISERKRWVATVEDEERVPRAYLQVDMRKVNAAVKAGTREIPGVRIERVDELAVRAR